MEFIGFCLLRSSLVVKFIPQEFYSLTKTNTMKAKSLKLTLEKQNFEKY